MSLVPESSNSSRTGFVVSVNGQTFRIEDPVPDSRQILEAANFVPADECVLIQVFEHGSRAIGLDETIDLRNPSTETFYAFRADRVYRFTVDERGFEWGTERLAEPELRKIAHVPQDSILVLQREDEPDRELAADDYVRLSDRGTEHLIVRRRLVTIYFKDTAYNVPHGTYTTEQLMSFFPIEQGYLLNMKTDDDQLVTLTPGQEVHIKDGMHFYSQPPGGGSS
jgi:hypothetical protein